MSSVDKLNELQYKKNVINQGGNKNELTSARKRINMLFDEGSFIELDGFVKHRSVSFNMPEIDSPADGVVTGYGTVNGKLVFAYSQDSSVINGAIGEMHAKKICNVMDMALEMGAPLVALVDSKGARLQEGLDALSGIGEIIYRNTLLSGVVPQITAVMGDCVGSSSFSSAISDFTLMVNEKSTLYVNGPSVINAKEKAEFSLEDLGGANSNASNSGNCHVVCANEEECINSIKKLIDLLPSNNLSDPEESMVSDDINRISNVLANIIPDDINAGYNIIDCINEIVDSNSFFEIQSQFAKNLVIGLARMNKQTVGIIANQPLELDGSLNIDACDKGARFVDFCDSFNIPIVTLVDVPGFFVDSSQEFSGMARKCAKLYYSYAQATVPKVTIITRKAYSSAYVAMGSKHLGADIVLAWADAEIAILGPDAAANIILSEEIKSSENPLASRGEIVQDFRTKYCNPYVAAERGYINDIIEADSTRPRIISALEMLASKRENRPSKKHGNMPL